MLSTQHGVQLELELEAAAKPVAAYSELQITDFSVSMRV